jgi:hypothetical protein
MHRSVLRVLRPAESAVRRLIILAAQGLVAKPAPVRQVCLRPGAIRPGQLEMTGSRRCRFIFQLHDPRKSFTPRRSDMVRRAVARISVLSFDPRIAAQWSTSQPVVDPILADDGLISGQSVNRRLHALQAALQDIPHQAQRLLRWQKRRLYLRNEAKRPVFISPLRPGFPPGYRHKPTHEVEDILIECHGLARSALMPDTS